MFTMNFPSLNYTAHILLPCIRSVGGHDGLSIFNTVERYDPLEKVWTMVTPMQSRRCRVGVTTARGKLFRLKFTNKCRLVPSLNCVLGNINFLFYRAVWEVMMEQPF